MMFTKNGNTYKITGYGVLQAVKMFPGSWFNGFTWHRRYEF